MKKSNKGATLIEYTLILSLIVMVLIAAYKRLGGKYVDIYNNISTSLDESSGS